MQSSMGCDMFKSAAVIAADPRDGRQDFMRATHPATSALLMLVPLALAYPSVPKVLTISVPGAANMTYEP